MSVSKFKWSINKTVDSKRNAALSSMRRENSHLKKTLAQLNSHYSQQYKLVEGFLSLEMLRLKSSQLAVDEPLRQNKEISIDGDSSSSEQSSTTDEEVTELRNQLKDVLEMNQQWLEYDQQREANVKAILDRMSWLKNQLNEANQARSHQHNEAHSDEEEKMSQMQDHYETLLQKAIDELKVMRVQADATRQELMFTKDLLKEKEEEVEELRQQLESERKSEVEQDDHDGAELSDKSEDYQSGLDMEKRSSDIGRLQVKICQKVKLYHQHEEQKKIEDLQRQINIFLQDVEDEKQNCSYLTKQMVKVLKMMQKKEKTAKEQSKTDQQAHSSDQDVRPKFEFSTSEVVSAPQWNLLDESFLECPKCQVEYPASRYRELLTHIDVCLV